MTPEERASERAENFISNDLASPSSIKKLILDVENEALERAREAVISANKEVECDDMDQETGAEKLAELAVKKIEDLRHRDVSQC